MRANKIEVAIFEQDSHVIIESDVIGLPGAHTPTVRSHALDPLKITKSCAPTWSLERMPASRIFLVRGIGSAMAKGPTHVVKRTVDGRMIQEHVNSWHVATVA
jgi:hypothetical protein